MNTAAKAIRDTLDNFRAANTLTRALYVNDAIRQLFIAERTWRGINKIEREEERRKE